MSERSEDQRLAGSPTQPQQFQQTEWCEEEDCSPGSCTVNTLSPHATFFTSDPQRIAPVLIYAPEYDYNLQPDFPPTTPPTDPSCEGYVNMTFRNPFHSSRGMRHRSTSGTSAGSLFDNQNTTKRTLNVSSSTDSTTSSCHKKQKMSNSVLSNLSSNGSTISGGRTPESSLAEDPDKTLSGPGVPAVCESCPEGETSHQSLVVCLSCPDQPALCQLCKEAHLRVALTRNHTLKFLLPNHLAENVKKLIALSTEEEFKDGENFDSNLQITTTELGKPYKKVKT